MNDIAIIGYTGFVGSFLNEKIPHSDNYNSKNIQNIKNKTYKTIYFAGLPAQKWLINKNPEKDKENIKKIINFLDTVTCDVFYLFSTIDIFDKKDENKFSEEPYGKNRYEFECYVKQKFKNHFIVRLPALFGIGLKKNMIFDIINDNKIENINPNINYQWYDMSELWHNINFNLKKSGIYNFFSPTISTKTIIENCFGHEMLKKIEFNNLPQNVSSYEVKSSCSVTGTFNICNNIKKFIALDRAIKNNNISISCLSWKKEDETKIPFVLHRYGIKKVEIAPTRYFNWADTESTMLSNTNHITKEGIEFYSMQSLFNGIDVNLFENQQRFIDHFFRVIDIALLLGAKRLVYGSPLTRKIENISQEGKFIEIFNIIADRIKNTDMVICIEPNSKKYGCNYLHDLSSSSDIIRKINRPNIRLNFDSGNAIMENDDESTIYKNMDIISHAHVSNPFLKEINTLSYKKIFKLLVDHVVINIEMKEIEFESISKVLNQMISELYD